MTERRATPSSVATGIMAATLLLGACSNADANPTTTAAGPVTTTTVATTTTKAATTTTVPDTTTTEATTTTVADPDTVGDPQALRDEIEHIFSGMVGAAVLPEDTELFYPDLTNLDPVVALGEAWLFEGWVLWQRPHPEWAPVYTYPDSPAQRERASWLSTHFTRRARTEDFPDSYTYLGGSVVALAEIDLPEHVEGELPEASVAVLFESELRPYAFVDVHTGDLLDDQPGYPRTTWAAILAPTQAGWRIFYYDRHNGP